MRKLLSLLVLTILTATTLTSCSVLIPSSSETGPDDATRSKWSADVKQIPGVTSVFQANSYAPNPPTFSVTILAEEKYYANIQSQLCAAGENLDENSPVSLIVSNGRGDGTGPVLNIHTQTKCPEISSSYARMWRTMEQVLPEQQFKIYPETSTYSLCNKDCELPLQAKEVNDFLVGVLPEFPETFTFNTLVAASIPPQTPVPLTFTGNKTEIEDVMKALTYLETPLDAPNSINVTDGIMTVTYFESTISEEDLKVRKEELTNRMGSLTLEIVTN